MTNIVLAAQAAQGGSGMSMLLMMVAIFAIMWFFMIRPQQKKQKEIQKFQNALTEGTDVVIGGGSVVTKDIPDNMLAYGNPCRVIREITEADRDYYFRDRKFDVEDYK